MSKLFKLKEWLTVPDAARHLSIAFGEEVSEADVLRLALDGHLKLSVNFVNKARARCGRVVPIEGVQYREFPLDLVGSIPTVPEEAKGKPVMVLQGLNIDDKRVLELDSEVVSLEDVWDLPMIGAERLDIEHEYQNLTNGPAVTLINIEGAFVERTEGQMCQLQDDFDNNEYQSGSKAQLRKLEGHIAINEIKGVKAQKLLDKHKEDRKAFLEKRKNWGNANNYYPAGGLPKDAVIVVRTAALRKFEQSVNDTPTNTEKPLTTTERNSLLAVIAALCDYSAIDPAGRGTAGQIAKMSEEIGAPVTDDTIRKILAKIPDALESRKK